ncbi:helix-turn-helix domain-containing protein [Methylosinus sp. R-45379]|uniref:helix-turn-helix transcriptional regulator n=1 Tax=Methylosinus sp. R-45379 TaxID=980563 RepID=UPI0007C96E05
MDKLKEVICDLTNSSINIDDRPWTIEQLREWLGISRSHAYNLNRSGGLPKCCRVGRRIVYTKQAIEEWLAQQQAA